MFIKHVKNDSAETLLNLRQFTGSHYLPGAHIDAGGVGVAASSVRTIAVVDWLTLVSVLPPSSQALTGVRTWSCLYTFGLQGAVYSVDGSGHSRHQTFF